VSASRTVQSIPFLGPLLATWRGRFIAVFLLAQLLIPLHYYAGRKDPHDERFAWRMFSPMRLARCAPMITIDDKPLQIETEFHFAWIKITQRGRFGVLEAMGARLCAKHPGSEVRVSVRCTYVDREDRTYGGYNMCNVPEL
jgi:hypothetical protein